MASRFFLGWLPNHPFWLVTPLTQDEHLSNRFCEQITCDNLKKKKNDHIQTRIFEHVDTMPPEPPLPRSARHRIRLIRYRTTCRKMSAKEN